MRTFDPLAGPSDVCNVRVSLVPESPSDLRIPGPGGPAKHVPVAVVKPRDMP